MKKFDINTYMGKSSSEARSQYPYHNTRTGSQQQKYTQFQSCVIIRDSVFPGFQIDSCKVIMFSD